MNDDNNPVNIISFWLAIAVFVGLWLFGAYMVSK